MSDPQLSMFVPVHYTAPEPGAIVRAYPFATLFTASNGLRATATPLFFETDAADESNLIGHVARRNPHATALVAGETALAVFSGPHAYISPRWYVDKPEVPTWDYTIAQVRGSIEPIEDPVFARFVLERTAQLLESGTRQPWTMEQAPGGRVDALLPHIVPFRISITGIEGALKLSQRHPQADRLRVMRGLLLRGAAGDIEVARQIALLDDYSVL